MDQPITHVEEEAKPDVVASESGQAGATGVSLRQIAHELGNLLDGSIRNVGLAMDSLMKVASDESASGVMAGSDSDAHERLETANEALRQMAGLLRLWMSDGPSAPPSKLYKLDARFGDALAYALRIVEPTASAEGIRITVDLDDEVIELPAGPISTVLVNVLRNAVEAVGPEGNIDMRIRMKEYDGEEWVRLEVEDDGPGISQKLKVDWAGRPEPGQTTKSGGHGIGLAIVKQIFDELGGAVRMENARSGGAIFSAIWPTCMLR